MTRTIVIPANGEYTEEVPISTVFAVYSSTGSFLFEPSKGGNQPMQTGSKYNEGKAFKRFTLRDTSGGANTVTFYAGTADVSVPAPVTVTSENATLAAVAPVEGITVIAANDTIQALSTSAVYVSEITLYPAKAVSNGVLTPNTAGDVYIGRSATYLPDKRATTDTDYPCRYTVPTGKKMLLSSIRIRGKAGDGVFYTYLPA